MKDNDAFNQLRSLLEGKTVAQINPPNASEAICCFVLTDGTAFRLHATDLGFWIEETAGPQGYQTLHGLLTDYSHHLYDMMPQYNFDPPPAVITLCGHSVKFTAPDGKSFDIDEARLSQKENKIIKHPKGKELLEMAAAQGDMWKMDFFRKNCKTLPDELLFTNWSEK